MIELSFINFLKTHLCTSLEQPKKASEASIILDSICDLTKCERSEHLSGETCKVSEPLNSCYVVSLQGERGSDSDRQYNVGVSPLNLFFSKYFNIVLF